MVTNSKLQISKRGIEMPESPIRKLAPLAYKAEDKGVKIYRLNIGQPDLPTPQKALDILKAEPERIERLWDVTNYALKRFKEEGFEIGDTESPIIPLYIRDVEKTFLITALAFERGVFINPVVPPACAPQDTLVRYALMATHTKEQVDRSVEILKGIFREQGVIK